MASYLIATVAAWLAATLIAVVAQSILQDKNLSATGWMLDEKTYRRRRLLSTLGRFAFALLLVYLLRLNSPVEITLQVGLQLGALAGALVYLPLAFEQLARFSFSPQMIVKSTLSGVAQGIAAGIAAALVFQYDPFS